MILISFGATAQAEDPYSGIYTCSGNSKQGCGTCTDFEMTPPNGFIITKSGDAYKICSKYEDSSPRGDNDCSIREIVNGEAHWSQHLSVDGMSIDAKATATFSGSSMTLVESGIISGQCNCNYSLKAICTK